MRTNFFELNSKGPYQSSENEKESRCHDIRELKNHDEVHDDDVC